MSELPRNFRDRFFEQAETILLQRHEWALRNTDSPIEAAFATAYILQVQLDGSWCHLGAKGIWQHENPLPEEFNWALFPQQAIKQYTADFVAVLELDGETARVVVECDGHAFHERTKKQAAHDRARDRLMQSLGYKVFRFTGSEIHADAFKCVREVITELYRGVGLG